MLGVLATSTVGITTDSKKALDFKQFHQSNIRVTTKPKFARVLQIFHESTVGIQSFRIRAKNFVKRITEDMRITSSSITIRGRLKFISETMRIGAIDLFQSIFQTSIFQTKVEFITTMVKARLHTSTIGISSSEETSRVLQIFHTSIVGEASQSRV